MSVRVVIVGDWLSVLGGIEKVIFNLSAGLSARGHDVWQVGVFDSPQQRGSRKIGLNAPIDPTVNRSAHETAQEELERILRDIGDGWIVTECIRSARWMEDIDTRNFRLLAQFHPSYEYSVSDATDEGSRAQDDRKYVLENFSKYEAFSFSSEEDVQRFQECGVRNAIWLPNPVNIEAGHTSHRPRLERTVLTAGRLAPIKRFDRLIDSFSIAGVAGWKLRFVGDGSEEAALRQHAADRGLEGRVEFAGRKQFSEMESEYRNAEIFALSSEHEGFGMVLAEAALCGLPSVAFNVSGGVRSIVKDGITGFLAEPDDIEGFGQALRLVMRDTEMRERMGSAAMEHAQIFQVENAIHVWEKFLGR
ncbi:glycosyltransferase [Streptomyces sp. VNUA24]|uniref:glycosyltransferase n=1 Tax=Streptomyces sp. VNUA24 TaxID=3031131 RepID=UPI0023B87E3A|nr:glycosyltransferase [Streptomyces sp. VNUA24]WEH18441.1 glycosyltransferase [Streptomyces sp. VNUA24]